jgi:hypothetical protein
MNASILHGAPSIGEGTIIILQNIDPPEGIEEYCRVDTHNAEVGRQGFLSRTKPSKSGRAAVLERTWAQWRREPHEPQVGRNMDAFPAEW